MESKKCKYCDKIFEGHTKNQVEHQYIQHVIARHKDKIRV